MTTLQFRQQLQQVLASMLGRYRLANGAIVPACSVRRAGEPLPAGQTVEGLELIIQDEAELEPIRAYRNERLNARWIVWLVLWSGATDAVSLNGAASRIVDAFPGATMQSLAVPVGVGPVHQVRLEVPAGVLQLEAA
jgi:hypothetical protein